MKKTKKILGLIITMVLANLLFISSVYAANRISVSVNRSEAVSGTNINVTVVCEADYNISLCEFSLDYDKNLLTIVSGDAYVLDVVTTKGVKKRTYYYTFKTKSSGKATLSIVNSRIMRDNDSNPDTQINHTRGSASVTIKTQAQIDSSKSSNRDLSILKIDGYELTPSFDTNILEYTVELEHDVTSIKINATAADKKAKVTGTGTHEVTEGENKIEIAVTAENGNRKIYVINAIVKELNPVKVNIGGEELTVVRKTDGLEIPLTFKETTTVIGGEEVLAFESSVTKFVIVALRDTDGNVGLYIVEKNGKFTLYKENRFSGIVIFLIIPDNIPDGYVLDKVKYNGEEITVYRLEGTIYPLIYGINIDTGEENWYTFDEKEGTLQRYVEDATDVKEQDNLLLIVTGCVAVIAILSLIILNFKLRKKEG